MSGPCWSVICDVDVTEAVAWLNGSAHAWPEPTRAGKPQRLFALPPLFGPLVDGVLACLPVPCLADGVVLSRMPPGESHGMHRDLQRAGWLTRVHVPLVTNPRAWIAFEGNYPYIHVYRDHFEVGKAYSFDTLRRHAFGNDGDTERVHLLFDAIRKE